MAAKDATPGAPGAAAVAAGAAAGGSAVRTAAAAIDRRENSATAKRDRQCRSRARSEDRDKSRGMDDPDMGLDTASGTMAHKDSLPDERPATKSHVMGLLAQLQKDMEGTMEKGTKAAVCAANNMLKAELFEHFGNLLTTYDEQSPKTFHSNRRRGCGN